MRGHTLGALFALPILFVVAPSCVNSDSLGLGREGDGGDPGTSFSDPAEGGVEDATLTSYCPSNKCPAGHMTCPNSYFPCDVDLKTDRRNCGACGAACPGGSDRETFACVDGRCVMTCNVGPVRYLDCDGVPDNGCETRPNTNEHCGGCGQACPDPNNPCLERAPESFGCGCPTGMLYCTDPTPHCANRNDDENCGACGNACPREGDGRQRPANTYFGCGNGVCGELKCDDSYANCDGEIANGCEAYLLSNEHCGGCGKACEAGTKCAMDFSGRAFCACPDQKTFCGFCRKICIGELCGSEICIGSCRDLTSDVDACGGCGVSCNEMTPYLQPYCSYGSCEQRCPAGRGDCNGNYSDGCEVNTKTDPHNCGGCNIACDAVAGQACVDGRCVLEPCDQIEGEGGTAR